MDNTQEQRVRLYFDISVILKGAISALEIVAGIIAFFVPVTAVTTSLGTLAIQKLGEGAGTFIATQLAHAAQDIGFMSATFIALYLLSRGIIKLALIIAMLKNKLWAYPYSLLVLGAFVLYQCYQIVTTHSSAIIILTLFDLVVMYFIWREYTVLRSHQATISPQL